MRHNLFKHDKEKTDSLQKETQAEEIPAEEAAAEETEGRLDGEDKKTAAEESVVSEETGVACQEDRSGLAVTEVLHGEILPVPKPEPEVIQTRVRITGVEEEEAVSDVDMDLEKGPEFYQKESAAASETEEPAADTVSFLGEEENEPETGEKTGIRRLLLRFRKKKVFPQEQIGEEEEELEPLVRVKPSISRGLTGRQVQERMDHQAVNTPVEADTLTLKDIVKENVFTYFNLIFLIIAILLCVVGSFRDLTFLPIIIANTCIGIFQEWRSKKTLDKLTILSSPKTRVVRDGKEEIIPAELLVLDDLVIFEAGNQIPADAVVEEGEVSVNEALITGEADEITKKPGDALLSGSFIVSGQCKARLDKVGADSYVSKLTLEAKARKSGEESEMIRSLDRLVKIVGVLIIPIAILLFSQQFYINGESFKASVTATVAAVIGMIPEGLYLLASVAMAVSVMRLATGKVLVHNMKSIETLARVDVLCVDKTGTITENTMMVKQVIPLRPVTGKTVTQDREYAFSENPSQSFRKAVQAEDPRTAVTAAQAEDPRRCTEEASEEGSGICMEAAQAENSGIQGEARNPMEAAQAENAGMGEKIRNCAEAVPAEETGSHTDTAGADMEPEYTPEELAALELQIGDFVAGMSSDNITMKAMQNYFRKHTGKRPDQTFPFSSAFKYSGAVFGERNFVLGAPEFLLRSSYEDYRGVIERYSSQGYRVLVFGEYQGNLDGKALTAPVLPRGIVLLANPIRENAPETFRYFADQGVAIKVISGDNPVTVSEVAKEAGIAEAEKYVDASTLYTEEELLEAADTYTVFGRVTPEQKRQLVAALKQNGHTVAMTGDGVNDVLALKDADCSIAMASGSDAAAHAAQIVLLESDFSRMPSVVAEGRRVVNNIERTASLFLVKNIFSLLMSVFSIVFMMSYPMEPSQISLISMFTIGIPAFLMSLEQNKNRIQGHFLSNVFFRSLPAGLTDFIVISGLVIFCQEFKVGDTDLSTSCTILLAIVGIMILYRIASPMTKWHWAMWFSMIFGLLFCMVFMNHIFAITTLSRKCGMLLIIFAIITEPALRYLSLLIQKIWDFAHWVKKKIKERKTARANMAF